MDTETRKYMAWLDELQAAEKDRRTGILYFNAREISRNLSELQTVF